MSQPINLAELSVETQAEAQLRARIDYRRSLGLVIYPLWICGYIGDTPHTTQVNTNFRVGVRVLKTPGDCVTRMCDEFCDPEWDVEIVDDPEGLAQNLRSIWTGGQSYETPRRRAKAA